MELLEVMVEVKQESEDASLARSDASSSSLRLRRMSQRAGVRLSRLELPRWGVSPVAEEEEEEEEELGTMSRLAALVKQEAEATTLPPVSGCHPWLRGMQAALLGVACATCAAAGVLRWAASNLRAWGAPCWLLVLFAGVVACAACLWHRFLLLCMVVLERYHGSFMYFIAGLRRPLQLVLTVTTSFAAWFGMFGAQGHGLRADVFRVVARLLACALAFSLAILLQRVAVKGLALSLHNKGHFARIQRSLRHEWFIACLTVPRNRDIDKPAGPSGKDLEQLERYVRTCQLRVLSEGAAGQVIDSEPAARKVALYLMWNNLPETEEREHLVAADLVPALALGDAQECFDMFRGQHGVATIEDVTGAVLQVYTERSNLAAALTDASSIMAACSWVAGAVLQALCVFLYLLIFRADITSVWLTFSTIAVAFSFIFSSSVRNSFENALFLVSVHAYDIGDLIAVGGETYTVHSMSLHTSVLQRSDGTRVWFPNASLARVPVDNLSRSGNAVACFQLALDINTPHTVLDRLQAAVQAHVDKHPADFTGTCSAVVTASADPLKMLCSVEVELRVSRGKPERLNAVRHGLFTAISSCVAASDVRMPPPPVAEQTD